MSQLSARAVGVYAYMLHVQQVLSAEELAVVFKEGRDAFREALNELKREGLIWTSRTKLNGKWVSQSGFSAAENQLLETRLLSLLHSQYSNYSQYTNMANSAYKPNVSNSFANPSRGAARDENYETTLTIGRDVAWNNFEYSADDKDYMADASRERQKALEQKQRDYEGAQQAKHDQKLVLRDRRRVDPTLWTPSDSAFEFANLLHNRWDVPPWRASKSRFIPALANARKKHNTNGLLEKRMMEMFLVRPMVQTMKDPDAIWKFFISSFGSLLEQARYEVKDPVESALIAEEQLRNARAMLGDD